MQDDDFSTFWYNDEHAQGLFYDLLARAEQCAYDDDFIIQLAAYRKAGGDAAHADIFAAQYLLANGDAESAVICAERAFRLRAVEPALWAVLRRAYTATERYADALVMQAYTAKLLNRPLTLPADIPHSALTPEVLDRLSVAMGKPSYAPMALSRMSWEDEKGLCATEGVFAGEFIPATDVHRPPYYVATYTEQEQQGNK
ncbi:MAG: choline-sulfatase, partial [Selenomonas sp.]|nr:choline-sulfatase [Selenomonas sp.]